MLNVLTIALWFGEIFHDETGLYSAVLALGANGELPCEGSETSVKLLIRTGYLISKAQHKMEMWNSFFKMIKNIKTVTTEN